MNQCCQTFKAVCRGNVLLSNAFLVENGYAILVTVKRKNSQRKKKRGVRRVASGR